MQTLLLLAAGSSRGEEPEAPESREHRGAAGVASAAAGPTPTGVTRGGSHPALRIPAPRERSRRGRTQALAAAPLPQQRALPAAAVRSRSRDRAGLLPTCLMPRPQGSPTACQPLPTAPQARAWQGGSGSTPPARRQVATPRPGRERRTAAGMLIHPAHVPARFLWGQGAAAQLGELG